MVHMTERMFQDETLLEVKTVFNKRIVFSFRSKPNMVYYENYKTLKGFCLCSKTRKGSRWHQFFLQSIQVPIEAFL